MGYHRLGMPAPPASFDRGRVTAAITRFVAEEIAFATRTADPFGIENACTLSPSGLHVYIGSCGDVACIHCSKVVWR